MTIFKEEIYESNVPIKYVFEEGKRHNDKLIIIFSNTNGNEKDDEQNQYDYLEELKKVDCNKLFILDNYGPEGCYYLGFNLNFEVETSVASLISYILNITNVLLKNIIIIGTNEGGSAALYFGLKYNMGNIIVGNPHIKIADYILKHSKATAEYLLGFSPSKFEIKKLNKIIIDQLNKKVTSKISIINDASSLIKNHSDLLIKEMDDRNIAYELSENTEIQNFNNNKSAFLKFLFMRLTSILENINIKKIIFDKNIEGNCMIKIETDDNKWISQNEIRLELRDEDGLIKHFEMDDQLLISHSELKKLVGFPKLINFEISISRNSTTLIAIPLEQLLIGNDVIFKGTKFSIDDGELSFLIDLEDSQELEFAFYIRKNNKIIERFMYCSSREIKVPVESPGKYQIQYFIRNKLNGNKILSQLTEVIELDGVLEAMK